MRWTCWRSARTAELDHHGQHVGSDGRSGRFERPTSGKPSTGFRSDGGDPGWVVEGVGFTSDSRLAFINYDQRTELWDPQTKKVVATWIGNRLATDENLERSTATVDAAGMDISGAGVLGVVRLGFTPDGRVLATVDSEEGVLLWDTMAWTKLDQPEDGGKSVAAAAAPESSAREVRSPDGRLAIRLGDVEGTGDVVVTATGDIAGNLGEDGMPVVSAAFTPDGSWVAVADRTRNVRAYRWEMIAPLAMLEARAGMLVTRPFTDAERARYLPSPRQRLLPWR